MGAVATAWDTYYPGTERTENLHNIAIQGMKNTKRPVTVTPDEIGQGKITALGLIDIDLPDIEGKIRKLTDLKGKVVLLDFTAYSLSNSQERIMQLRTLYGKYAAQGLEIYQVSIDPDEHYWKTACEHLPWICVYEAQGEASPYIGSYLVRRRATFFLIDRQGNIVARDEQVKNLEKTVKELCAK